MKWCASRIDELGYFFLTETVVDGGVSWDRECRQCSTAFSTSECRKPQGAQMVGDRAGRQLLHGEQLGLVFPNMSRAEAIGRAVEVLCESFDGTDIVSRVVASE